MWVNTCFYCVQSGVNIETSSYNEVCCHSSLSPFRQHGATVFQIKACFDILKILSRFLHELSAHHERPSQISNLKARVFLLPDLTVNIRLLALGSSQRIIIGYRAAIDRSRRSAAESNFHLVSFWRNTYREAACGLGLLPSPSLSRQRPVHPVCAYFQKVLGPSVSEPWGLTKLNRAEFGILCGVKTQNERIQNGHNTL